MSEEEKEEHKKQLEELRKNVFDNLQEIERLNNIIKNIENIC